MTARTAIIGCGNANRSDDGVGPAVIRRLQDFTLPQNVELYDAGTDGMAVLYKARGAGRLIVVDARAPEGNPGAIYDVPGEVLRAPPPHTLNLHDFRWDHAIYAGHRIYGDDFPADVRVFLIEAERLDLALGLSLRVEAAAEQVTAVIAGLIDADGPAGAAVSR